MNITIERDGKQYTYSEEVARQYLESGDLDSNDIAWVEGGYDRKSLAELIAPKQSASISPPNITSQSQNNTEKFKKFQSIIQYVGRLRLLGNGTIDSVGGKRNYSVIEIDDTILKNVIVSSALDNYLRNGLASINPVKLFVKPNLLLGSGIAAVEVEGILYMEEFKLGLKIMKYYPIACLLAIVPLWRPFNREWDFDIGVTLVCAFIAYKTWSKYQALTGDLNSIRATNPNLVLL